MSLYAERIEQFNRSLESAREHAENVASQVESLQGINRDPTKSLFNKINDTVGVVAGTTGQAAQIYHTYKHGKVLTFLERHDINQALGKAGNGGLKNAGNEVAKDIDDMRNAPVGGVAPNSSGIQLPKASELVSSLKGRLIGNESQGSSPADLGQLVDRTTALPDKADNLSLDDVNRAVNLPKDIAETALNVEPEAAEATGTAVKQSEAAGFKLFTPKGLDQTRAGASEVSPADRLAFAKQFTETAGNPKDTLTNAISGGDEAVENVAKIGGDVLGDVSKAKNIAGGIGKAVSNTLGKISGEGGGEALGDTIASGMEAVAPETGAAAPLVAAVGGLVALGTTIAGLFHKNKPPPPVTAPPPPAAAQIGADLSVSK